MSLSFAIKCSCIHSRAASLSENHSSGYVPRQFAFTVEIKCGSQSELNAGAEKVLLNRNVYAEIKFCFRRVDRNSRAYCQAIRICRRKSNFKQRHIQVVRDILGISQITKPGVLLDRFMCRVLRHVYYYWRILARMYRFFVTPYLKF